MILKFEDRYREMHEIAKCKTIEKLNIEMKTYLSKINFKSYYYNITLISNSEVRVDYGSHSEFFYVYSEKDENLRELFGFSSK